MRTFTALEMAMAMDRYSELTSDHGNYDFWDWLAVDWEKSLTAERDNPTRFNSFNIGDDSGLKVDLLLSPHYQTLYKAYLIKHGETHEQSRHQGLHSNSRR